ncbi:MAG TPA: endonuclease/exonuclease/phosphatase family protein [Candidatus Binataceae bacterium]|nr:endonuclease/exonuclease/phosphatase family protein [Candidatus Binataceae bacterium]
MPEPTVVNRPARRIGPRIRVVELNARGGARFETLVACLKRHPLHGAGLIMLCEADVGMKRSDRRSVAAELAERMEMSYAFIPEWFTVDESGKIVKQIGNAILSASPVENVEAVALPFVATTSVLWSSSLREKLRGGFTSLITSIRFGSSRLSVGVAHLHSRCDPRSRERQMAAYMSAFPASGPAIVAGDLNSTTRELSSIGGFAGTFADIVVNSGRYRTPIPHEPLFERMFERGFSLEHANVPARGTFTYHRFIPRMIRPKLDWIAVRDLRAVAGTAAVIPPRRSPFDIRASDHDFITAEIEL